jgi:hypothetical protein
MQRSFFWRFKSSLSSSECGIQSVWDLGHGLGGLENVPHTLQWGVDGEALGKTFRGENLQKNLVL